MMSRRIWKWGICLGESRIGSPHRTFAMACIFSANGCGSETYTLYFWLPSPSLALPPANGMMNLCLFSSQCPRSPVSSRYPLRNHHNYPPSHFLQWIKYTKPRSCLSKYVCNQRPLEFGPSDLAGTGKRPCYHKNK